MRSPAARACFEALEDRIHRGLCLGAGQTCALDHVVNDVLFNQSGYLAGATGNDCTTPYAIDGTDFAPIVEQGNQGILDIEMRKRRGFFPSASISESFAASAA